MNLTKELSDDLVQVEDCNTDFDELYYEIKVLGMTVASYGGNQKEVQAWAKQKSKKIREAVTNKLKKAGWVRDEN